MLAYPPLSIGFMLCPLPTISRARIAYHMLAWRWWRREPLVLDRRLLLDLRLDRSLLGAEGGNGGGAERCRSHAACSHLHWRTESTLGEHLVIVMCRWWCKKSRCVSMA